MFELCLLFGAVPLVEHLVTLLEHPPGYNACDKMLGGQFLLTSLYLFPGRLLGLRF